MNTAAPGFAEVLTGRCPSCGANVEFKIGASRATICAYCKSVVARKGQDLSIVGKVSEVIPTGTKIALGTHGQYEGRRFEVLGRLQYKWQAGVWDEWNIGFSDGRYGWLAEAQGRFYVTFKVPPRPLPARVSAGKIISVDGLGRFTVTDVKRAQIVGASGELPDPVAIGETPLTADLESEKGGFATLDYGTQVANDSGVAAPTVLFVGTQVSFESLHLSELAPLAEQRLDRPTGAALKCPKCGAPITLRIPDQSQRVVCDSCHSLLDCTGALRVLGAIAVNQNPAIPIGTSGVLRGKKVIVAGWMIRGCDVDYQHYTWEEFLLWEEKTQSFFWLVNSTGHWQFVTPISAGAVHAADDADYQGVHYQHYSSVQGTVEIVLGEFFWQVHKGETSQLDDYIAPPHGLSRERGNGEVNWTYLEHIEAKELSEAFKTKRRLDEAPVGTGEIEPWPYQQAYKPVMRWYAASMAAMFALFIYLCVRPDTVLLDETFDPGMSSSAGKLETSTTPSGETVASYISPPFDLDGGHALWIRMHARVDQGWAYVSGAVINNESGLSSPFSLEATYYSGVDEDESWHEGDKDPAETISAPAAGTSILRADFQWDPKLSQPEISLKVITVSFSFWQFLWALIALSVIPLWMVSSNVMFEGGRWEDSNLGDKPDATHSRNEDE